MKKWQIAKEEIKNLAESYAYFTVIKYAVRAKAEYEKILTGQEISNDELLQRADMLVNNSLSARRFFRDKYKCIYVDEFQDTDHIQANLIWNLALDENENSLREGALFVVGDPKQAIYRFRGGEPAVYYKIKEKMKEMSIRNPDKVSVYELDDNYRSNEQVIQWVNREFAKVFGSGPVTYRDMQCKIPQNVPKDVTRGLIELEGVYCTTQEPQGIRNEKVQDEACMFL